MGNTGNSTGTHLHLECSTTQAWQCNTFLNPGEILGFGNERGTIIEYSGTPSSEWISRDSALNENEMKHNADILISYYRSQGINDKTIAGILANMQAESTINPRSSRSRWPRLWISSMDASKCFTKSLFYFRFITIYRW